MTVEVKQILKPKSVETAEDDMPDKLKSQNVLNLKPKFYKVQKLYQAKKKDI